MLPLPYSITHRPDLGALIVRWPEDAPLLRLQNDFEALLAVALQHTTGRWLLDVRRRDQLNLELGRWTTELFFPEAAARLAPEPLRLSVLCSPTRMAVYAASAEQQRYLSFGLAPERAYRMQLFGDEGTAMQWLLTDD